MQFDYKNYIPCLKWKQGEYLALSKMDDSLKNKFLPLIEVPEIGWDFEKKKNNKSLEEHLDSFTKRIVKKWGMLPCIIDIKAIESEQSSEIIGFIFNYLREEDCSPIPTIALNNEKKYLSEIKTILKKDKKGLCLRIPIEDAYKKPLKKNIDDILASLNINIDEVNLILDCKAPNYLPIDSFLKFIKKIFVNLAYLEDWKAFSILGTSIPESMAGIKDINILNRNEWIFYKEIIKYFKQENLKLPVFSDYVINNPKTIFNMDMRKLNPAAKIKYTIDDKWLIAKGKSLKKHGFNQFRELCRKIILTEHYCGSSFSYGDEFIDNCAKGKNGTGNLSTWVEVGTNHHINKVIHDISSLFDS